MKYNFIPPHQCNFFIGIINTPLIIIIYLIISLTRLEKYFFDDNIFELFNSDGYDAKNVIHLILLSFVYGVYQLLFSKIIYDYTIYHIYIPFLIENFIHNIMKKFGIAEKIFLISSFVIELITILIFLEIIEINFCKLNKNLKKNIKSRSMIESSSIIECDDIEDDNNDDDEIGDERN